MASNPSAKGDAYQKTGSPSHVDSPEAGPSSTSPKPPSDRHTPPGSPPAQESDDSDNLLIRVAVRRNKRITFRMATYHEIRYEDLIRTSKYLVNEIRSKARDGRQRPASIVWSVVAEVGVYFDWLREGELFPERSPPAKKTKDSVELSNPQHNFLTLLSLYTLGDHLLDDTFKRAVVTRLTKDLDATESVADFFFILSPKVTGEIWETKQTLDTDYQIKQLIIDLIFYRADTKEQQVFLTGDGYPEDFTTALYEVFPFSAVQSAFRVKESDQQALASPSATSELANDQPAIPSQQNDPTQVLQNFDPLPSMPLEFDENFDYSTIDDDLLQDIDLVTVPVAFDTYLNWLRNNSQPATDRLPDINLGPNINLQPGINRQIAVSSGSSVNPEPGINLQPSPPPNVSPQSDPMPQTDVNTQTNTKPQSDIKSQPDAASELSQRSGGPVLGPELDVDGLPVSKRKRT
ncbi:hypothetical protein BU24DRAFT_482679 [Aaosphaeria arxii CBS 175.79]|uniref:Uncharacterized protein n=1 Tax=Aaosphaeria arxii CBS 175.79 TaxID=1450172 RepID=A0A6A5XQF9_9PLEO|nr:uncharacterized protein BU24DRAFT_482679 [Aaosphaeria arxii CBS 175.79]KAF2015136.1 hypothetical protein BU24DRAFT_482679 [Aaosphaeria arxii CBS 175.79]